jgi:hypothetical protein
MYKMLFFLTLVTLSACKPSVNADEAELANLPIQDVIFKTADKVQVVAYQQATRDVYNYNIPLVTKGKYIENTYLQRVTLTAAQIDSLYNIIYHSYDLMSDTDVVDCYNPHHAILFSAKDSVIACYEICFDCLGTRQQPNMNKGRIGYKTYCKLYRFFNYELHLDMKKQEPYRSEEQLCH